jgi:predicted Zn finger-like uncharacterized protein
MKIVCDACQAKYSISDDKVQGKVFKIRCKKCSNIIVVRGGAGAAEPAPAPAQEKDTRVYDYGYEGSGEAPPPGDNEAVWHVVINQDQVGPMTAAEVQQRFAGGDIDAETYAWREGFADWIPLSQVDAFADLVASGSTTTAAANDSGGGASAVAAMFGGAASSDDAGTVRSDPGDLFAAASGSSRAAPDDDNGGDLFGSKPVTTQAQAQAASSKLRGERNENSVLFSLNNLAQLASDKPAPSSSSSSSSGSSTMAGHASGAAGGEGSGLIDIRSMASAYMGGSAGSSSKPSTASAIGSIDDLPVFGGGGFSEPAVIVPTARAQSNPKMMYILIGSVGLLAVAAIILVVVLLSGGKGGDDKKPDTVAAAGDVPKPDDVKKPDDTAANDTKKPDDTAAKPDDTKKPDDTAAKPDDTKKPDDVKKPVEKPAVAKVPTTTKKEPTTVAKKEPTTAKKEPTTTAAKEPASAGGCDEVSCVLSNYEGTCCAKYRKGPAPKPTNPIGEKPKSDVPEALDRTMIADGVGPVKARVMSCGDKSSAKGTVKVSVKVNPDGGIAAVSVKQTPDPALGSCVAAAMQKARFKRTQTGGTFGYPFVF